MNAEDEELPKTLIVDLGKGYGGSSSRALMLLQELPPGKVALIGLDNSPLTKRAQELELPVYTVCKNKADPRIAGKLIQIIRAEGYQLIDTQNIQSKFWGSIAAARTGISLVSTMNSWYSDEHGNIIKGHIYQTIELLTNKNLDLYITVSSQDRNRLLKSGISHDAVELILNSISIKPEKITGDSKWLRQKFDLPDDAIVCCAVGRLVWQKGYEYLIESVNLLVSKYPQIYCLIMGDGHLKEKLSDKIAQLGLQKRIRLLGFLKPDEVLSIVKSSDIFVMPSRYEGTPIALLEAAALARPILATKVGGIPEIVEDGKQALLVQPEDSIAFAEGFSKLCNDLEFAKQLGSHARNRIQQEFSLQAQVEAIKQAYRKAWQRCQHRLQRIKIPITKDSNVEILKNESE